MIERHYGHLRGGATDGLPAIVEGYIQAQAAPTAAESARLVRDHRLPREALRTEHLGEPEVWEALLEDMPMTAMIRNLATMTRVGVVAPGSAGTAKVVERLADGERLRKARVHPIAVLAAVRTYASGRGVRGRHSWQPVAPVVDALDAAFYAAFGNVETTGSRLLLALDVSGSMTYGTVAGAPGLTPRPAQALRQYRERSGIEARLVVVGMVSNGFSIADPSDPGMLDVVGFDTGTPAVIADFAAGSL